MIINVNEFLKTNPYGMDFTQEALEESLMLIEEAVQDERNDEMFYDYLISVAPTMEEKEIIKSIRDDERVHRRLFQDIYIKFSDKNVQSVNDEQFTKPKSYLDGVKKAIFGELSALEKYRIIREGIPCRYCRDIVLRILTDEMKHAIKYNYILNINSLQDYNTMPYKTGNPQNNNITRPYHRNGFTINEAMNIARNLGIDFNIAPFSLEQFLKGLNTEYEIRRRDYPVMPMNQPMFIGRIVYNRLMEFPNYYD